MSKDMRTERSSPSRIVAHVQDVGVAGDLAEGVRGGDVAGRAADDQAELALLVEAAAGVGKAGSRRTG